jgi:hypothetical protein
VGHSQIVPHRQLLTALVCPPSIHARDILKVCPSTVGRTVAQKEMRIKLEALIRIERLKRRRISLYRAALSL